MASKTTSARFNDYIYDPLFIVSGKKDYYKAAMNAKLSSAKFAVCPIFPSMFSDLPHQPRQQLVMRRSEPIPDYEKRYGNDGVYVDCGRKGVDVLGGDRYKFFRMPIRKVDVQPTPVLVLTPPSSSAPTRTAQKVKNKKVQTQYRESSAQTVPWRPDELIVKGDDPELLLLDFLKWGSRLPAGMQEVRLIERARMKRSWEESLPPAVDAASMELRRRMIEATERDEWLFREKEIQDIQDLRLELLIEMLNELLDKSKTRVETKMKVFCATKQAEKEAKLKTLRRKTHRELRKLEMRHRDSKQGHRRVDIVKEHIDKKSELYGPLMRHGQHPRRRDYVIDDHLKRYNPQYLGVEDICTLPRWLDRATKMSDSTLKMPGTRLCIRDTKWTTPVLKQLHGELKRLRRKSTDHCSLLVRVKEEEKETSTPQIVEGDDWEEELHQASVLIQSILRGRASQVLIYEGRNRCRELIQELRSTHALQEQEKVIKRKERAEIKTQHRDYLICTRNIKTLQETLNKFSSSVVGTLLDFLNKEHRRLVDERRIHAMCLMFARERHYREAAEAGRRQAEMRRRLEHDEMFKQVVKVHQDTVDMYLQDIITEGMEFASKAEARGYVENLGRVVDAKAYATRNKTSYLENLELVSDLVHNFLLPEVEKQMARDRIKKKQRDRLRIIHKLIFDNIDDLPLPKIKPKNDSLDCTGEIVWFGEDEFEEGHFNSFEESSISATLIARNEDINVIFSATQAGHNDFEATSIICPAMEQFVEAKTLISEGSRNEAYSDLSLSTPVPKLAETNINIRMTETSDFFMNMPQTPQSISASEKSNNK